MLTCSITTHHGDHRLTFRGLHAEVLGYLRHDGIAADGASQTLNRSVVGSFDERLRHVGAASKATAATVGSRKERGDLTDARIGLHGKLLGHCIEQDSRQKGYQAKNQYRTENIIHNVFVLMIYVSSNSYLLSSN